MFGEERTGKFHREKLVLLARRALRRQRFIRAMIKARRVRRELGPPAAAFHEAVAVQIQAQLDAARMKTRRPVELALRQKVMPLDAVTHAAKTAEDRLPARAHVAPRAGFGKLRAAAVRTAVGWRGW